MKRKNENWQLQPSVLGEINEFFRALLCSCRWKSFSSIVYSISGWLRAEISDAVSGALRRAKLFPRRRRLRCGINASGRAGNQTCQSKNGSGSIYRLCGAIIYTKAMMATATRALHGKYLVAISQTLLKDIAAFVPSCFSLLDLRHLYFGF